MLNIKSGATERRERIRAEFWSEEIVWTGEKEKGWFRAPRTLSLILALLSSKEISGKSDPTRVYLELLTRHRDSGIVEMVSEGEHSFFAGYSGSRGIRTWQERMKLLEQNGFIKAKSSGNLKYKYVVLVHPAIAVHKLREAGKIPDKWWDSYRSRQIESRETMYESLLTPKQPAKIEPVAPKPPAKVVPTKTARFKPSKKH